MFLTAPELHALTGLRRPSAQYGWLRRKGWPVERDARGRPLVLRSVVEARLGGEVSAPRPQEPNWSALKPRDIKPLPIERLRELPPPDDSPGIYFLWLGQDLVYVGQSRCVVDRIEAHKSARMIQFDRATCLAVDLEDGQITDRVCVDLTETEFAYIREYQPPKNVANVGKRRVPLPVPRIVL